MAVGKVKISQKAESITVSGGLSNSPKGGVFITGNFDNFDHNSASISALTGTAVSLIIANKSIRSCFLVLL